MGPGQVLVKVLGVGIEVKKMAQGEVKGEGIRRPGRGVRIQSPRLVWSPEQAQMRGEPPP